MSPIEETQRVYRQFRTGDDREIARQFFHVEHRDVPGTVIPFEYNALQTKASQFVRRALALNLKMQADAARSGGESYIPRLLERLERGEPIEGFEIGLRVLNGKSRRGGASTFWGHVGFRRASTIPYYTVLVMAHDQATAEELHKIVRVSYDHFPLESKNILPEIKYKSIDRWEYESGARYAIRTSGMHGHEERSRGWRFDYYHFSEYAHYKSYADVAQIQAVARPHAWIIKESTARGRTGPFYREWHRALTIEEVERAYDAQDAETLKKWNGQYQFFFSWLEDPGLTTVVYEWEREAIENELTEYEQSLFDRFPGLCTLEKIKWRRQTIQNDCQNHETLGPEQLFSQEFPATPEEMFQSGSLTVFDQPGLDAIDVVAQTREPVIVGQVYGDHPPRACLPGNANFWCYEKPKSDRAYVIGADVSLGVGKDSSVAVVLERGDGTFLTEVACYWSNQVDPKMFGFVLALLGEWYNNAFICCEVLGGGLATNKAVVEDCRYPWVYHRRALDLIGGRDVDHPEVFRYGFWTSNASKHALIGDTRPIIRDRHIELRSRKGIDEFRVFEEDGGKYGAPEGAHDDYVIAVCLAVFAHLRAAGSIENWRLRAAREKEARMATSTNADESIWALVSKTIARSVKRNRKRPDALPPVDEKRRGE